MCRQPLELDLDAYVARRVRRVSVSDSLKRHSLQQQLRSTWMSAIEDPTGIQSPVAVDTSEL